MNYKKLNFEVKSVDEMEGIFEGVASTIGNVDLQGDVIMPGAFTKTLRENAGNVILFANHGHKRGELPIGRALDLQVQGQQLIVKGKISKTPRGLEVLTLMADRVMREMSIGFEEVKRQWKDGVRQILELKLFEISIVDWGANPQTSISYVKQLENKYMTFDEIEQQQDLLTAPGDLMNVFRAALDSISYDAAIDEAQRYNLLHDSLARFSERFTAWIEDAYQGGYLKEHRPKLAEKGQAQSLAPPEPPQSTQDTEPQADEAAAFLLAVEALEAAIQKNNTTEV
jgi:HK97 family phage prohead protease